MNTAVWSPDTAQRGQPGQAVGVGLWVFIGVATALFSLFLLAYLMRMTAADWWSLTLPWQLWVSTAWLVAGSLSLEWGSRSARRGRHDDARRWLLIGGACAAGFLAAQWWAWQALQGAGVTASGNPAGSFFYLLTAMHGLHVLGGLVAWVVTTRTDTADAPWRIRLCARYWHFLLAVWVVLFAAIGLLTPEIARVICGPLRII
ncbi:MAG TPA: cytochrome c oxidase subunit 3 [Albitalea sp.]|uniref:cytochrome c oxidase subunit 3 n=1 Tax=Piscinibacter sp. TaxID=1903157 RepID=UPI002ED041CF